MGDVGYEEKIQKLKDKIKRQKRDLKRLQNENGTRSEQIARINEKVKVLTHELTEREKEHHDLGEKGRHTEKPRITTTETADGTKNEDNIDDLTIIEKFNNLLNVLNKEIEESYKDEINYYTKQQNYNPNKRKRIMNEKNSKNQEKDEDPENDAYARSNIISVKIKRVLEGSSITPDPEEKDGKGAPNENDPNHLKSKQGLTAIFRISASTIFDDLFKESCNFWGITEMNEYELIDETESILCEKSERVENYFKQTQGHFNQYMLYLRKKINQTILSQSQKEAIKVESSRQDNKVGDPDFSRPPKREIDHYKQFFDRFVGLKAYIDVEKVKANERKGGVKEIADDKKRIDDYSCVVFTIILFIMFFTLAPLYQDRDDVTMYYTVGSIQNEFGVTSDIFSSSGQNNYTFQNIQLKADFYNFLNNTVAPALFFLNPATAVRETHEILSENILIGAVRLRQMKVQASTCTSLPTSLQGSVSCYPETYSEDTRFTNTLQLNTEYMAYSWESQWGAFQTAEQLGQKATITGWLANYDGSAYTVDIPTTISINDMVNFTGFLQANDYITLNTKALLLTFLLYNQAGEFFLYSEMLIEESPSGVLYPNPITVIPFRKSFRESSAQVPNHAAYDALRAICAVVLSLFVIYRIINGGRIDIFYLMKFQGMLNVLLCVLCFVSVGYNIYLGNDSVAQMSMTSILESTSYIDMKHLAIRYQNAMILMAIISGLAILRLTTTLGAHGNFTLISLSLEIATKQILSYLIILIPLIIGFTIAALNLFGPHVLSFSNFQDSFVSMLLFGLGQIDPNVFDQSSNSVVAIIFFTIYYFFIVFCVVTVFAGIYIDSYRLVVMQKGYSMGKDNELKLSDLIGWLLPRFIFRKLKNGFNSLKKKCANRAQKNKQKYLEKDNKTKETEMTKTKQKSPEIQVNQDRSPQDNEERSDSPDV